MNQMLPSPFPQCERLSAFIFKPDCTRSGSQIVFLSSISMWTAIQTRGGESPHWWEEGDSLSRIPTPTPSGARVSEKLLLFSAIQPFIERTCHWPQSSRGHSHSWDMQRSTGPPARGCVAVLCPTFPFVTLGITELERRERSVGVTDDDLLFKNCVNI